MNARDDLTEIIRLVLNEPFSAYALNDAEVIELAEEIADAIIERGWPRTDYEA